MGLFLFSMLFGLFSYFLPLLDLPKFPYSLFNPYFESCKFVYYFSSCRTIFPMHSFYFFNILFIYLFIYYLLSPGSHGIFFWSLRHFTLQFLIIWGYLLIATDRMCWYSQMDNGCIRKVVFLGISYILKMSCKSLSGHVKKAVQVLTGLYCPKKKE